MRRLMLGLIFPSLIAWGQSVVCRPSARAIFLGENGAIAPAGACDSASGVSAAKPPASPSKPVAANPPDAPAAPKPAVATNPKALPPHPSAGFINTSSMSGAPMSAMMYWVELIKPGGESQRVTTDQVFRSGESIRLHFQSNVAGRLTIAQLRPDGSSQVLFPDSRVNAGDNLIEAKVDTAIPPSGRFRFDNETGTDRLMVFLHPGASSSGDRQLKSGSTLGADETTELTRTILTAKRGIILETDARAGSQFVAMPGSVAMEIQLKHR